MIFEPRNIVLKNGAVCTLRPTHPDDAARMIDYLKQTAGETEFLLRYPDEVQYTLEQEQAILNRLMDDPKSVMMVGIVDGEVAGNCSIGGLGEKRKTRHRCSMGIALKEAYWNLGIGTAMIGYLTELEPGHRHGDDWIPDRTGETDRLCADGPGGRGGQHARPSPVYQVRLCPHGQAEQSAEVRRRHLSR